MNRPSAKFRFTPPSKQRAAWFGSLVIPSRIHIIRPVAEILSWTILGLIIFSYSVAYLFGQSPEITAASQPGEEINPQYEANVKAAYLYGFARYIKWQDNAFSDSSSPFIMGICGECAFEKSLDRLAQSKTIQGRQLVVKKMASSVELEPCHILFVSHSIPFEQQLTIITKMNDKSVLLVGEVPGFAEQGGGINFYLDDKIVRFEVNVDAIRREGLALTAKLLSLGKKLPSASGQQIENLNER